jgi:thiamine-phosphate pyrophosphorylase
MIGVSAHSFAEAKQAEEDGASFAVLAPIFAKAETPVKGIGLDMLREACMGSRLPVLALGGVNLTNARSCLDAGAAGIAGIRLFQQGDVSERVKRLREFGSLPI